MKRRRRQSESNLVSIMAFIFIGILAGGGIVGAIGIVISQQMSAYSSTTSTPSESVVQTDSTPNSASASAAEPKPTAPVSEPKPTAPAAKPVSELNPGPAAAKSRATSAANRPYSARVNEKTLLPEHSALDTPLRAHQDHPWVKLVKAEIEKPDGTRHPLPFWKDGERIVLDYETSADFLTHPIMSHASPVVLLKNERGETTEWNYRHMEQLQLKGNWIMVDGKGRGPFAFSGGPPSRSMGRRAESAFTPNMEVFVVLEDWYDRKAVKRYKISNSLSIGDKKTVSLARDWKDDEVQPIEESVKTKTGDSPQERAQAAMAEAATSREAFGGAPPKNVHRSATIGAPGGGKYEFAKEAPVLGLAYKFGEWDKHPSIAKVRPVFKDLQVSGFPERVMANDGYAVGGVNLEASPYISGIQVIFMRLEGKRLNPADSYTSDWIRAGSEPSTEKATYQSDGKLVIGVYGNNGAVVNTMGLIFDK